ncbi:MAG TPA: glycoside hydrolase family 172 protein [Terracidiphilus sp.]|nr:glycoside hydrolase family 172 protein [Terracidiphilus sp.]
MSSFDPANTPSRRRVLTSMLSGSMLSAGLSAGAALGLSAAPTAASAAEPDPLAPVAPDALFAPARLRTTKPRRSSSWDRTGGNGDSVPVDPGKSATILDVTASGVVTHLWFTINSRDPMHLKNLVLRAWWDGEATPSIEVPIGDFFGLGLGDYFTYQSALTAVAPIKALNAYFKMPFATSARLTVENQGSIRTDNLYFAVDYVALPSLPSDLGRFHAQYRQAAPCHGWTNDWTHNWDSPVGDRKNLSGKDNYVFLEATGRGHFLGVTQAVLQNQEGWFGEGDDMIFLDGDALPTINGTGTEDYYNGAWDFGGLPFAYPHNGAPFIVDPERIGGRYCLYRWHTESPIAFEKSIRVTMEHGHANHRSDNFYTTAYWYQTEPHAAFPALPSIADRIPRVFAIGGGAGSATPPAR